MILLKYQRKYASSKLGHLFPNMYYVLCFSVKNTGPFAFNIKTLNSPMIDDFLMAGGWHQGSLQLFPAVWHKEAGFSSGRRHQWGPQVLNGNINMKRYTIYSFTIEV